MPLPIWWELEPRTDLIISLYVKCSETAKRILLMRIEKPTQSSYVSMVTSINRHKSID